MWKCRAKDLFLAFLISTFPNGYVFATDPSIEVGTDKGRVLAVFNALNNTSSETAEPLKTITQSVHNFFFRGETAKEVYEEASSTYFGFTQLSYGVPDSLHPQVLNLMNSESWRLNPASYKMKHRRAKEDYTYERGLLGAKFLPADGPGLILLDIQTYWDKRQRGLFPLGNAWHLWGQWVPSRLAHIASIEAEKYLACCLSVYAVELLFFAAENKDFAEHAFVKESRRVLWQYLIQKQRQAREHWYVPYKEILKVRPNLGISQDMENHSEDQIPPIKDLLRCLSQSSKSLMGDLYKGELAEIHTRLNQLNFLVDQPTKEGLFNLFPLVTKIRNRYQFRWGEDLLYLYFARLRSLKYLEREQECSNLLSFRFDAIPMLLKLKPRDYTAESHPKVLSTFVDRKIVEEHEALLRIRREIRSMAPPIQGSEIQVVSPSSGPSLVADLVKPQASEQDIGTVNKLFKQFEKALLQSDLLTFFATTGLSLFPKFHEGQEGLHLEFYINDEIQEAAINECKTRFKDAQVLQDERILPSCDWIFHCPEKKSRIKIIRLKHGIAEKRFMLQTWHKYTMIYLKKYLYLGEKGQDVRFMEILRQLNNKLLMGAQLAEVELLGCRQPKRVSVFRNKDHLTAEGYIKFLQELPAQFLMLISYPKENVRLYKMVLDLTVVNSFDAFSFGILMAIREKESYLSTLLLDELALIYLRRWQTQPETHPFGNDKDPKLARLLGLMLFRSVQLPQEPIDEFLKNRRAYLNNFRGSLSDCIERLDTFQKDRSE